MSTEFSVIIGRLVSAFMLNCELFCLTLLFALPLGLLISISTVFVKQHSILDFFVAVPFTLLVHFLVYGVIFRQKKTAPGTR